MSLLLALRQRAFALLWLGQTTSRLGDHLYRVALAWWVLEHTGSATAMGTVQIFAFTPMLLFLLIGGVAVDRFPRLRIMLASDALRLLIVAVIALLAATQQLAIWHIYAASLSFGFLNAFFEPAYVAAIPDITPAESLPSANSLTSLSREITGVLGPAIGATIVALGGTALAFALDALSFGISALCLLAVPALPPPKREAQSSQNLLHELRSGIGIVLAAPWLWITIVIFALVNITSHAPLTIALPFLISNNLHADVGTLGLFYALESAGLVLGSLWLGRRGQLRRRGMIAYGASLLGGLALLLVGLPIGVAGIALALLLIGVTGAFFGLIWTNTLQERVPRELMGRVSSVDMLGSFVLLPVGYGVAGWATDQIGAPLVFVIGGALTMLLIGLGLLHPAIRRLD